MFDRFCTRRKWFLAIVAGALGTLTAGQAGYAQGGTWTPLAPVSPAPAEGMTVGGVGQVIVAAYGFSPVPGNTNQTRLYNINTDSWSTGTAAPMPVRADAASGDTTHGGFLYVIGGEYDIDTNTWSPVAPLPNQRSDMAAVAHGGKIYVFGGCSDTGVTKEVDMYDPQTNTWTPLAIMLTGRASLVAGHSGDKVYAIGGTDGVSASDKNEVYDVAHNSWSANTPMTAPRQEAGVNSHGGRIYVVGGAS